MPAPVAVRRQRARLASLNDASSVPAYKSSARKETPDSTPVAANTMQCCDNPNISTEDGTTMCYECGRVISQSDMVNEITFGETASGAAMVQGGFVGDDQRHANTMGGTVRGLGGMESREKTLWKGKDEIQKLISALRLRQTISDMAVGLYKIALGMNFVQGRRIRNVAACCIYLADRKQHESTLLLMDLCEKIHVNVWVLGDTYKQFLQAVMMQDPTNLPEGKHMVPQLEPLVLKFCRKLEFGHDAYRVAEDAVKMLKRMHRDWIVEGRQPAGIIGAAIILAARMNNFRRTIREVVYCVKVADSTINKRLHEFKRTKSSALTVDQFRDYGLRVKDNIQPPSIWRREEREEKKRKRAAALLEEADASLEAEVVAGPSTAVEKRKKTAKRRKTTKGAAKTTASEQPRGAGNEDNAFLVPDIRPNPGATPEDAMDFESAEHLEYVVAATAPDQLVREDDDGLMPLPKKLLRKPRKKRQPIVIPEEEIEIEEFIEEEIRENLRAWETTFKEFNNNEDHPVLRAARARAQVLGEAYTPNLNIPDSEDVNEDEFEDDEDVKNCINTPAEVAVKEKVWINENEEWLREQQAKTLQKELEEASGKPKKVKHKRKRTQMGDGSVLEGKPAASAKEAVEMMMKKRAKNFSSAINYEMLENVFADKFDDDTEEGSSFGATPADSGPAEPAPQAKKVVEIPDDEEEEEEEDDDDEPTHVEEDLDDDPNMYLSDEDVGYDDEDLNDDF